MSHPQKLARPLAARVKDLPSAVYLQTDAPDLPESVLQAASEALARGETHYTDRPGILALREWAAKGLARFNIGITPKEITITCGSTEARFVAIRLLAKPETNILCLSDASDIVGSAQLLGAQIVNHPTDPISVLYLTPNEPLDAMQALTEQAVLKQWWVIYDMSKARPERRSLAWHPAQNPMLAPKVVTIDGLSDFMPGWRVGWMVGSEMADKLRSFKQAMTICSTSVSQWAAVEMMRYHAEKSKHS